jgi:hypothetical protein
MLKRLSLVRLRGDVPRDECLRRWFGEHADIVRGLPEVREYTVDVAEEAVGDGGWDAVATLRFDNRASMQRSLERPEIAAELARTRAEFAEAVQVLIVDEHRLVEAGTS